MRNASRLMLLAFIFGAGIAVDRLTLTQTVAAQVQSPKPDPGLQPPNPPTSPNIISGTDIGFRIDSYRGRTPVGTLVVRVNGQWVEVDFGTGVKRLTSK